MVRDGGIEMESAWDGIASAWDGIASAWDDLEESEKELDLEGWDGIEEKGGGGNGGVDDIRWRNGYMD
jgi:hypothetical protein